MQSSLIMLINVRRPQSLIIAERGCVISSVTCYTGNGSTYKSTENAMRCSAAWKIVAFCNDRIDQ